MGLKEWLLGTDHPTHCVVMPSAAPGDFDVQCDISGDLLRRVHAMDRACVIEIHRDGKVSSLCDKGMVVASRLYEAFRK